ncbi:MAG: glutamyl-tRNA reductase [Candidatus Hydrogenedentota bacterium]
MPLTVTGLSHHTSPVALRERMAFDPYALDAPLRALRQHLPEGGLAIVSTCNRVEVYTSSEAAPELAHKAVRAFLAAYHDLPEHAFARYLYHLDNREAVAHLFRVAASLDSMVVGEAQILGQVQEAFLAAQTAGTTDKILNQAFQTAFKIAKQVRTESDIAAGRVSVSSVAVELAVHIFENLADKTVLVIGSGETGKSTLTNLVNQGVARVLVANRTPEKAQELAAQFEGEAMALEDIDAHLHKADIVISSTAAKTPILQAKHFQQALKRRAQNPMFAIDIAVPRDIHPSVRTLDNVYLYDMDDLQEAANQNLEARRAQVATCQEMIDQQVTRFITWYLGLRAEPTIVSMRAELDAIRERELEKTLKVLGDSLEDAQRQEIEYLTKRIVNNILRQPMTQIKREIAQDEATSVLGVVKRLFGLSDREELL